MHGSKTPPPTPALRQLDAQKELNRLHRRRIALINLIRSVEEYLMVTDSTDTLLTANALQPAPASSKKPNLRVIYTRALKEMMA